MTGRAAPVKQLMASSATRSCSFRSEVALAEADDRERQTSPPSLGYESAGGDPAVALGAALAGVGSVFAAVVQFALICGSPRMLFFHVSDAAPAVGSFTRFDRLCFVVPSLLAIGLGLFALPSAQVFERGCHRPRPGRAGVGRGEPSRLLEVSST